MQDWETLKKSERIWGAWKGNRESMKATCRTARQKMVERQRGFGRRSFYSDCRHFAASSLDRFPLRSMCHQELGLVTRVQVL